MFCRAFGNREITVIQDMYSPSKNLGFKQNNINTMVNMKTTKNIINIREKVRLESEGEYDRICDVVCNAVINEENIVRDTVKYAGDLNLKFILSNSEETNTKMQEITIPFAFNQEIEGIDKDSKIDLEISKINQEFTKDNNDVSVKIDLEAITNSYNAETISVIDNIEELEWKDENPYSMVIYFVKPRRYFVENSQKIQKYN